MLPSTIEKDFIMVHKYKKITVNDGESLIVSGGKLSLKDLQKHVGGDIEIIALDNDKLMVVNENGINEGLEQNITASIVAGQTILGDVLYCKMDSID